MSQKLLYQKAFVNVIQRSEDETLFPSLRNYSEFIIKKMVSKLRIGIFSEYFRYIKMK